MIDHDKIAALVHRADSWDRCYPGSLNVEVLVADLTKAARALNDEGTRLRADLRHVIQERDATFALMLARAEAAEAERDRVAAEWAETSQRNYQRAKAAEAERVAEWNRRRKAEASRDLEKAVCATIKAERDRLLAALDDIAAAAFWIANEIHIGPEDEGRDIYDMALAIRDDASAAMKGPEE